MSKSILVIDDPMRCDNCLLAKSRRHIITKEEHWFCGIPHKTGKDCEFKPVDIDSETKPDWCPIKPLPEKYEIDRSKCSDTFYEFEFEYGYNQCID